ncbi:MAG: hypothetical protein WAW17_10955 [Rhodococcus sp. (in: high G+C Gram-positive bacteria)]|uniref:hypothetical protein n=1 Tax=Rhodococcus sp. TaxID=1831 RepID=UPI003BB140FA
MYTEPNTHGGHSAGTLADSVVPAPSNDVFGAMFSLDLGDGDVDQDAVERIQDGELEEWVEAAARSGLFTAEAVGALALSWQENPKSLFDALLGGADEMTRKRYELVWDALDEAASIASAEYA